MEKPSRELFRLINRIFTTRLRFNYLSDEGVDIEGNDTYTYGGRGIGRDRRDYIKLGGAALAGAIVVGGGLQAFAPRTITETVTETEKQTITKTVFPLIIRIFVIFRGTIQS